jgi:polyphosphate kinase 2 (PPK2 family)
MDLKSYSWWYDDSNARDEMFATDTGFARWFVAWPDDKKRVRLNQDRPTAV